MFAAQKLDRNHVLSASNAVWELISGFNFHCLSEGGFDQAMHFFTSSKWLEATTGPLLLPLCELWFGHEITDLFTCISPKLPCPSLLSLPSIHGRVRAGCSKWEWMCVQEGKGWEMGRGPTRIAEGSAALVSDCSWLLMAFLLCHHFPLSPKETLCNTC